MTRVRAAQLAGDVSCASVAGCGYRHVAIVRHTAAMPWLDWSDYKRAQVANGLITVFFLVGAWRMWAANNGLRTLIFLAGAGANIVGGVWRSRQGRRGAYDVERPRGPAA